MTRIITVSREFGSGGRELAKLLAESLGFAFYDKEIIAEIARNRDVDERYVENVRKNVYNDYPYAVGKSFSYYSASSKIATEILLEERKIILDAAKNDCVIVGRGADVILSRYSPFNIFVYAGADSKIKRCRARASENESFSDKELLKRIKQIDKSREKHYLLLGSDGWGRKENYHLCINTDGTDVKQIIPPLSEYISVWFEGNK